MKGIILAGGTGSRLMPLTKVTNKHLLPVGEYPMIYYPLNTLRRCGIKDIMIVSGKGHAGHFLELLGSGREFGARISYALQEKAGGIAEALGLCEDFADNEKVAVILGDNIYQDNFETAVSAYDKSGPGAMIFLKKVADPERFGVARIQDGRIMEIQEKPKIPPSPYAVTGFYLYDSRVWEVVKKLKPSGRGELEITDVNNFYIQDGTMRAALVKGWWTDAGTRETLFRASILASREKMKFYWDR